MTPVQTGLLLFAHGARDPRWAEPFLAVADRIRAARAGLPVALAFLELMQPDLATATTTLVDGGCTEVQILPLFLGAGGHVRKDLPVLVEQLRAAHAGVRFVLHPPIGELPSVIDAIADAGLALLPRRPVP